MGIAVPVRSLGVAVLVFCLGLFPPLVAAQSLRPTPDLLLGRWTDDHNNCSGVIEFRADGTWFINTSGAQGRWWLSGDQLSLQSATTLTARVVVEGPDVFRLEHPDGTVGRSWRCGGAPQAAQALAPASAPSQAQQTAPDQLTIRVCNQSGRHAFTAVIYRRSSVWHSEGWFRVNNGECLDVAHADNLRFYAFAEEAGNTEYFWAGNFEHCIWRPGPYDVEINPNNTNCSEASARFTEWVADRFGTFTWTLDP